jgi:hypothetical protein
VGCGGTTGHDGIAAGGGGSDATVDGGEDSNGDFDVILQYPDRDLPEITPPPPDTGVPEGSGWPVCPPDVPAPPTSPYIFVPPVDSGACSLSDAGYVWTRSAACDSCYRKNEDTSNFTTSDGGQLGMFPPCADWRDAGTAQGGPGKGEPLFSLCQQLFQCIVKSNCMQNTAEYCYCGDASGQACTVSATAPTGPCKSEEEGALETTDPSMVLGNLTNSVGFTGGAVGQMFATMNADCRQICFGGSDAGP